MQARSPGSSWEFHRPHQKQHQVPCIQLHPVREIHGWCRKTRNSFSSNFFMHQCSCKEGLFFCHQINHLCHSDIVFLFFVLKLSRSFPCTEKSHFLLTTHSWHLSFRETWSSWNTRIYIWFYRRNILPEMNDAYLRSCRRGNDSLCPIFRLGDVVRETGEKFSVMAVEVGLPVGRFSAGKAFCYHCNPVYSLSPAMAVTR